jgi:hypothetical protein
VYVTKKCAAQQSEIHATVASLGGDFRLAYCPEVTHVVFTGKANDVTKEFKVAKADKKHIVAPHWVFMCKDENQLIEVHSYRMILKLIHIFFFFTVLTLQ